ncbi:MAG: TonB-dependent receptor [Phocaeicola plebeius]|uniref:SusC/RagA family TonB-linked outer membrane protein n=1 Tax=Phocaeicola plebeius TaxID=310297 RepID=UPI00302C5E64
MKTVFGDCFLKMALLLLILFCNDLKSYSQDLGPEKVKLTGKVLDSSGEPIIGANVKEKNSLNGTITDLDGNFSIIVSSDNSDLLVSYIGYITMEVSADSKKPITVYLKEDTQLLDEVVVIGYGSTKRKDFTGSVSSVKLENSPIGLTSNISALESLKSNVSGLDVGSTTSAGGTPSMMIRGQKSISGSNDPLVVVDGVIFMGKISDINPNDISSFDVLKDATSAAAYGSRAANGVIMITTKKGKSGKPTINFSASGGMQIWHLKPQLMTGEQWVDAVSAAYQTEKESFMTAQEMKNYNDGKYRNWLDESSRVGWIQDYQASVSGAGNKVNYYLSTSYTDSKGVIKGDDFNRVSVLGKINTNITDWLQIGLDAAYTHSDWSGVGANLYSAVLLSPYGMKYRPNGELEAQPDGRGHGSPLWGVDDKSKIENLDYHDNLRANAYLKIDCPWIDGLSYRLNYSGNLNYRKYGDFYHESYYVPFGAYDDDTRYSEETKNSYLSSANGYIANERTTSWVLDNILSYNHTFGEHSVDLTAVATRDYSKYEYQYLYGLDFSDNGNTVLGLNGLHYGTTQKIKLNNWKRTNVGYVARASYSYGDTYYFTSSYRRDGASVFGANNKWGNFYALGTAWRITNEDFMKKIRFLNDMKLKLSWGTNGNQGLEQYSTLSLIANGKNSGFIYVFGNSGKPSYGINQNSIGNSNLKWEKTEAWNLGFESAWFNNRLFVDLDVYLSRTCNQIFYRTIPVMGGYSGMYSSMGEVRNRGVDLTIRSVNFQNRDWNWSTGVTFWLNRNKLIHLYGEDLDGDGKEDDDIGNGLFIGESIHSIYGYKQDGIVQTTDTEYMEANGVEAGTPKYVDITGDGRITTDDRMILGSRDPNFKLNMSNTLSYKNFELYVMLAGTFGGNGYFQQENPNAYITAGKRSEFSSNGLYIDYWTEENPSNKYPRATFTSDGYFLGLQSRAYVRLQDVTLSYTFNQPWVKKAGIGNLKVYVTGKNLATITGWEGGDPETGNTIFSGSYPVMTTLSMGLNLSF